MKSIKETSINYSMRKEILSMNEEQLSCVIQAIKDRRTMIQLDERAKFNVGDKVWFDYKGVKKYGVIEKLNPKSIQVKVMKKVEGCKNDDVLRGGKSNYELIDGIWNVSATYLNHIPKGKNNE
jgi:hypothetical protein